MSGPVPPSTVAVQPTDSNDSRRHRFDYAEYREDHFTYSQCKYKGYAVIISNEDHFTYEKVYGESRRGSHFDKETLRDTLRNNGFRTQDIHVATNYTARQMTALLEEVARKDFTEYGCLVVAVMSYGEEFIVYGLDERVTYQQLISPFKHNKRARTLFDKPKLFIIQTEYVVKDGLAHDAPVPPVLTSKVIDEPDVIVAYSHDTKEICWRTGGQGTWFIQALCEVLRHDGRRLDVMNLLTRVNYLVRQYYESYVNARRNRQAYCPCIISLLTRRFNLAIE